ncbi:MAG: M48 family metallopeptidase [Candidatus Omnitrophota bacterium]|nr:M48 family metallopeptidase [Candidatus Omnitrophota bacterium]
MNEPDSFPAKKYHTLKNRLFFINLALNILFLVIFFFSGLSLALRNKAFSIFSQAPLINGFYIMAFCIIFYILNFPLNFYEGFILEHKFKLSNQNLLSFLMDSLKNAAVDFILFLIILEAVYFFLNTTANYWWVLASIFWIFFTLILAKITPSVIIPIFYKYIPITNLQLKQSILALFDRCKLKIRGVYAIDLSRKTKKANAFVCGLGRNRRVVLSDTLLNNFSQEEIEGVVSHELGHYVNHDTLKLILVNSILAFAGFFLADKLLKNLLFNDIAFFPIIALALLLLGFIILPAQNGFSRYLERQADLFSLRVTKNKPAFISMMMKLAKINLADLTPSLLIEIWLYDHPPIAKRIKLAQDYKLEN